MMETHQELTAVVQTVLLLRLIMFAVEEIQQQQIHALHVIQAIHQIPIKTHV